MSHVGCPSCVLEALPETRQDSGAGSAGSDSLMSVHEQEVCVVCHAPAVPCFGTSPRPFALSLRVPGLLGKVCEMAVGIGDAGVCSRFEPGLGQLGITALAVNHGDL